VIVWSAAMVQRDYEDEDDERGDEREREVIIDHPARDKAVVKTTKLVVIVLMLVTVGLMLVVTAGGWTVLVGLKAIGIFFMIVFLVLAFYAARWQRGVLPVAAALALILLPFAAVSGPGWFARDKMGFAQPALPASLLGLLTLLIIPVQILLIAFAMRGFQQGWNVEVERRPGDRHHRGDAEALPA